ncbi:MAG: hypothetical protein PHS60_02270, partial [Zavarzinia sp.]|nr:hypothetical protein [Zavarzinia sp.]
MSASPALALLAVPALALLRLAMPPGTEAVSIDARLPALTPTDHPSLTLWLAALLDFWPGPRGASGADGVAALAASACLALLFPWRTRHAVALAGILLGALAGPATSLLCLLCVLLWRGLRQRGVGGLVAIGFAIALMPLVHGAGAAMAVAMLPVIAAALPPPLMTGRATLGALMIIGFPVLVSALGLGMLAALFQGSPGTPYASLT